MLRRAGAVAGGMGSAARAVARVMFPVLLGAAVLGSAPAVPAAHGDEVRDGQQAVLRTLGLPQAWQVSRGEGVTVAVLDSGWIRATATWPGR
nr:hypothetical protein GCM10020093_059680 [Planobispora longispora]